MCTDMKELAATISDRPVYSICLGDMVHNNMSLWEDYCNGIKDFSFPVFHVIGNHDHIQNAASDDLAVAEYEKYLGRQTMPLTWDNCTTSSSTTST